MRSDDQVLRQIFFFTTYFQVCSPFLPTNKQPASVLKSLLHEAGFSSAIHLQKVLTVAALPYCPSTGEL